MRKTVEWFVVIVAVLYSVEQSASASVTVPEASCEDSPLVNCSGLEASSKICSAVSEATRIYCPKFCGICSAVTGIVRNISITQGMTTSASKAPGNQLRTSATADSTHVTTLSETSRRPRATSSTTSLSEHHTSTVRSADTSTPYPDTEKPTSSTTSLPEHHTSIVSAVDTSTPYHDTGKHASTISNSINTIRAAPTVADLCASNPCGENETCQGNSTWYSCSCEEGWEGTHCNITTLAKIDGVSVAIVASAVAVPVAVVGGVAGAVFIKNCSGKCTLRNLAEVAPTEELPELDLEDDDDEEEEDEEEEREKRRGLSYKDEAYRDMCLDMCERNTDGGGHSVFGI